MGPLTEHRQRLVSFLQEVRAELAKVAWPTRSQVRDATVAILATVLLIAFFIGAVDLILSKLFAVILSF